MGKKKTTIIGSENEDELKAKKAVKLEQKKLREGKGAKTSVVSPATEQTTTTQHQPTVNEQPPTDNTVARTHNSPSATKKSHSRSKAYKTAKSQISVEKTYSISEGLGLLRSVTRTNFDSTVELHITMKKAPEGKIIVTLPHQVGKSKKIAIADDEFIAKLESGKPDLDLDYLVASPAQMAKLVKFAKVLGPKGLMPNPKTGTVSDKPEETAKKLAADQSNTLKLDKTGPVIHTQIGKLSLDDAKLEANIKAIFAVLPANLKKTVLKSTMSPAIKISA